MQQLDIEGPCLSCQADCFAFTLHALNALCRNCPAVAAGHATILSLRTSVQDHERAAALEL